MEVKGGPRRSNSEPRTTRVPRQRKKVKPENRAGIPVDNFRSVNRGGVPRGSRRRGLRKADPRRGPAGPSPKRASRTPEPPEGAAGRGGAGGRPGSAPGRAEPPKQRRRNHPKNNPRRRKTPAGGQAGDSTRGEKRPPPAERRKSGGQARSALDPGAGRRERRTATRPQRTEAGTSERPREGTRCTRPKAERSKGDRTGSPQRREAEAKGRRTQRVPAEPRSGAQAAERQSGGRAQEGQREGAAGPERTQHARRSRSGRAPDAEWPKRERAAAAKPPGRGTQASPRRRAKPLWVWVRCEASTHLGLGGGGRAKPKKGSLASSASGLPTPGHYWAPSPRAYRTRRSQIAGDRAIALYAVARPPGRAYAPRAALPYLILGHYSVRAIASDREEWPRNHP